VFSIIYGIESCEKYIVAQSQAPLRKKCLKNNKKRCNSAIVFTDYFLCFWKLIFWSEILNLSEIVLYTPWLVRGRTHHKFEHSFIQSYNCKSATRHRQNAWSVQKFWPFFFFLQKYGSSAWTDSRDLVILGKSYIILHARIPFRLNGLWTDQYFMLYCLKSWTNGAENNSDFLHLCILLLKSPPIRNRNSSIFDTSRLNLRGVFPF
jgi:hypothetical protein